MDDVSFDEHFQNLRDSGFKWNEISGIMNVGIKCLYRKEEEMIPLFHTPNPAYTADQAEHAVSTRRTEPKPIPTDLIDHQTHVMNSLERLYVNHTNMHHISPNPQITAALHTIHIRWKCNCVAIQGEVVQGQVVSVRISWCI